MKKTFSTLLIFIIAITTTIGQTPESFNYQAVLRDINGNFLASQSVGIRISILLNAPNGSSVYTENFSATTTPIGLVNLKIGQGDLISGNFENIDWSGGFYFIELAIDVTGGTNYMILGSSQLMSVPYALHAKTVEVDKYIDDDADALNEIQDLNLSEDILTITNNETASAIDLSPYKNNANTQLTEEEVDNFVANNGFLKEEVDGSITNEIQDLVLTGNILKITKNGTQTAIDLSYLLDNSDVLENLICANGQIAKWNGSIWECADDNDVTQNLSSVLSQSNNGSANQIKNIADPTDPQDVATKAYVDLVIQQLANYFEIANGIPENSEGVWYFDGTLNDESGLYNLTSSGTTYVSGKIGDGFNFTGTEECSNTDVNLRRSFDEVNSWSVNLWFNSSIPYDTYTPGASTTAKLLFSCDGVNSPPYKRTWITANEVGIRVSRMLGSGNGGSIIADYSFNPNQWYHVSINFGGNSIKVYINGAIVGHTIEDLGLGGFYQDIGNVDANTSQITIGGNAQNNVDQWKGIIDQAYLYKRALTESEVLKLYSER